MTAEAQRIAIAEACGYSNVHIDRRGHMIGDGKPDHIGVPDYLSDLNAMREAEKVLGDGAAIVGYLQHLGVTNPTNGVIWKAVSATATERAEAFLKTLNLWTSPPN